MLRIYDRESRFYGFMVLETYVPEYPETEMLIDMGKKIIYINKGAREGAKVVRLNAYDFLGVP